MNNLSHLQTSAYSYEERHLAVLLCEHMDDYEDVIRIFERSAETPVLQYEVSLCERPRTELIEGLKRTLAVLEQLPEDGTLDEITAAMGSSFAELAV